MYKLLSSKHLEGVSDLTLAAPLKSGFIDAFESITYRTRAMLVMKALFGIRSTAREHSVLKPFVDTAERIQALLDFRLAIRGNDLLLSATFDRPFEPYMRLIWDPLGPLLDVIFCNCEGYVTATEHGFEDYLAWVRRSQIDTDFFYSANGHSIADIQYATRIERLQREATEPFAPEAVTVEDPRRLAEAVRKSADPVIRKESNQLGMEALVALYKLTDLYPPDRPEGDGKYLLWATQQLLDRWGRDDLDKDDWSYLVEEQLAWLERDGPPAKKACGERLGFEDKDIQSGILGKFHGDGQPIRHGALLLLRISDPEKARRTLAAIHAELEEQRLRPGKVILNLAFTRHGLVNIGLPQAELDRFPQEFREGMEERAGLLGDVRAAHPRRWTLPPRNGRPGAPSEGERAPVELSEVDIVIQLRTSEDRDASVLPGDDSHALDERVKQLRGKPETGLDLLSIEPMRRAPPSGGSDRVEHFGFTDGISQPKPVAQPDGPHEVPYGEIFWGYANSRCDSPPPPSAILDKGSFLVVRKLDQDVGRLRTFIASETARLNEEGAQIDEEDLYAKMMGRYRDGRTLVAPQEPCDFNDFTYDKDERGGACPFQAHVRRVNPRERKENTNDRPTPRILRRGMAYGPPFQDDPQARRGVFFMAYNASIAEQFEVIQRWIAGGNPTGVASWQSDPLMGVGQRGDPRTFRFVHAGKPYRVNIPDPFVKLQWGAYLFVPAMSALKTIATFRPDAFAARQLTELDQARRGEAIVARLRVLADESEAGRIAAAAEWKASLEDFGAKDPGERDEATDIWAAIRLYHGGALRVPYGVAPPDGTPRDVVLVASKDLVMRVFRDPHAHYSMSGQMARMKQSFGAIYLGMDKGAEYDAKSRINDDIFNISEKDAFKRARSAALQSLAIVCRVSDEVGAPQCKIDLRRHFITPTLATICREMFGIPDAPAIGSLDGRNFVDPFGWSWEPAETRKPRCPGDYMSTSRFCFYPDPIPRVRAYGKSQGQALRKAVKACFDRLKKTGGSFTDLTAKMDAMRMADGRPVYENTDELARTVIGVMTGFLPPTDGCLRWALYDWIDEKTLARVQHEFTAARSDAPDELDRALARAQEGLRPRLEKAMQKRPAPDMLWRTVIEPHRLGDVEVEADDRVFIGIVSALAEDAAAGITDVCPIFGGDRSEVDAPLHACPAYKAAMGTMLGMLSALLDNFRIEPLPATLLVALSDRSPLIKDMIASPAIVAAATAILPKKGKAKAKAPVADPPLSSAPAVFAQLVESAGTEGQATCPFDGFVEPARTPSPEPAK